MNQVLKGGITTYYNIIGKQIWGQNIYMLRAKYKSQHDHQLKQLAIKRCFI